MRRYVDHAAATPVLEDVIEAMAPWWRRAANASSAHAEGRAAQAALEAARADVAALVGAPSRGVLFTSGATEANALGVLGAPAGPAHGVDGDHPSLTAAVLGRGGVIWPRPRTGLLDIDGAGVLATTAAHHEDGSTLGLARPWPGWHHVDAAAAASRMDLTAIPGHAIALASSKLGGPQGMGALVVRGGVDAIQPQLKGGAQERGLRAGTVPVALAVGFGMAARLARLRREARVRHWQALDAKALAAAARCGGRAVGQGARAPGILTFVFAGRRGDLLVAALDLAGIAASSGAACTSGSQLPSALLRSLDDPEPAGALRLSWGENTTSADVDATFAALSEILQRG